MHDIFTRSILRGVIASALVCGEAKLNAQSTASPPGGIDNYEPGPDSKPQRGVPMGNTISFEFEGSRIYPGTRREITVYVPAQYKGDKPACLYVGLDAPRLRPPVVFDNLIHKREMPVTIAVGISSGVVVSANESQNPRFNRSFEFDSLNDSLARCITEEILPEVEKHQTPDGRPIRLSRNPNDQCAGGEHRRRRGFHTRVGAAGLVSSSLFGDRHVCRYARW